MKLAPKPSWVLTLMVALVLVGSSPAAAGPQAFLYEAVEDMTQPFELGVSDRVSHWAAQGTAAAGSPFCPSAVPPPTSCTITAFGTDTILNDLSGGSLHANLAMVINNDNVADAPEGVVFFGKVDGTLDPLAFIGVVPDLNQKKSLLGPGLPLIRVSGTFTPDPSFALPPSSFTATFRLPFRVTSAGKRDKPVRGKQAFYLGDDGSLIRVQPEEFAFGFPMLRAEVIFLP